MLARSYWCARQRWLALFIWRAHRRWPARFDWCSRLSWLAHEVRCSPECWLAPTRLVLSFAMARSDANGTLPHNGLSSVNRPRSDKRGYVNSLAFRWRSPALWLAQSSCCRPFCWLAQDHWCSHAQLAGSATTIAQPRGALVYGGSLAIVGALT